MLFLRVIRVLGNELEALPSGCQHLIADGLTGMEPTFISTPYMHVATQDSAEIRAMLDQQEASYLEWRRERKGVRHPFASQKLNSASKLAPVTAGRSLDTRAAAISPVQAVREKYALGPTKSKEMLVHGVGKRKDAIQLGVGLSVSTFVPRHELPRLSLGAPETYPELELEPVVGAVGGRNRKQSEAKTTRRSIATSAPGTRGEEASSRSARVPRAAYKYLKPYLHAYYTRQVFSLSSSEQDDATGEDSHDDDDEEDSAATNNETEALVGDAQTRTEAPGAAPSSRIDTTATESVIAGLELVSQHTYDAIFELDWAASGVEKTVRDAVDRKRIAAIVRACYRVLLWFFRFYAGNAAANAASAPTSGPMSLSDRLASALGTKVFEIPSALKLLEDVNIPVVDPAAFGIADAPLHREHLVDFVLSVARMSCAHASNPAQHRVLVSDGVELSEAVRALVHNHFAAFSQIQDVNHFRAVFLRSRTQGTCAGSSGGSDDRSLQQILDSHAANLAGLFDELARQGAGRNASGDSSGDAAAAQRSAKPARGAGGGVNCAQFVALLHGLRLIAVKSAAGSTSAASHAASSAAASSSSAASTESPVGIDEELRLPQLVEALLRAALSWRERAVCRGRYDVCPGQMSSDACACRAEGIDYAFDVFRDAVQEVMVRVHMHRLWRVQRRATVKMASVRSVRLASLRPTTRLSVVSTASGFAGVKETEETEEEEEESTPRSRPLSRV